MNASKYEVGQTLMVATAVLESAQTSPPSPYTETSLNDDMMGAYKFAKDDDDRSQLKEVAGIGTARTRTPTIQAHIDRGVFIRTKNKKEYVLDISAEGQALLAGLPDIAKDIVMTAKWERALGLVAQGKATPDQLISKVKSTLKDLTIKLLPQNQLPQKK